MYLHKESNPWKCSVAKVCLVMYSISLIILSSGVFILARVVHDKTGIPVYAFQTSIGHELRVSC